MGNFASIALVLAAGWGMLVAVLFVFQRSILFVPDPGRPDPAYSRVPEMTRVQAATEDGLTLEGWWRQASAGGPTLLYLHGNAGNIGSRDGKARQLIDRGYGVLLGGYRGYGGNPGAPSEAGLIADGRAWLAALEALGVPAREAILYGESLGAGVVVALATERAVAGVVLEAPFTSITDIAAARYWFVPVRRLLRDPFDTESRLPRVKAPILIIHGAEDRLIPIAHGERLFRIAPEPKRFARLAGGGHTDLFDHGAVEALDAFVVELR
jgi:fermentation-respiration switch protein FrsA (DUF1100 family)